MSFPLKTKRDSWTEDEVLALPLGEQDAFDRKSGRLLSDPNFEGDLGKALSAFANTGGGHLLLGVEDDGTFDGVPAMTKKGRTTTREWLEQKIPALLDRPLQDFKVHEGRRTFQTRSAFLSGHSLAASDLSNRGSCPGLV